ncbi:hypothetical protein FQN50_009685, partial [Emmonsiellopsis sp. PD_5]
MASALAPRYSSASLLARIPHTHTRPAPLPSPSRCLYRPFSQTARRDAGAKVMAAAPKSRSVLSNKNQIKQATAASNPDMIPDDMGILPGTFIRPLWKNRPSIFKEPGRRLHMEWVNIKMKFQNFAGLVFCSAFFSFWLALESRSYFESIGIIWHCFTAPLLCKTAKLTKLNPPSIIVYCKYLNRFRKLPLRFRERKPRALHLHKAMYTAFAA